MNLPRPEVIVFDAAGTLVHPARAVGETYAEVARHYGQNWDPALLQTRFRSAFRAHAEQGTREVPRNGDDTAWWRGVVRDTLPTPPEEFPFEAYFQELYLTFARPELWRTYPEVLGVLEDLRHDGYRLALLSNWDNRLHPLIEGLEIAPHLEARYISAELGCRKPEPEIFQHAAQELKVSPERILMVGDDPINDYAGPRAAGWQALLLQRPEEDLTAVSTHLLQFRAS